MTAGDDAKEGAALNALVEAARRLVDSEPVHIGQGVYGRSLELWQAFVDALNAHEAEGGA